MSRNAAIAETTIRSDACPALQNRVNCSRRHHKRTASRRQHEQACRRQPRWKNRNDQRHRGRTTADRGKNNSNSTLSLKRETALPSRSLSRSPDARTMLPPHIATAANAEYIAHNMSAPRPRRPAAAEVKTVEKKKRAAPSLIRHALLAQFAPSAVVRHFPPSTPLPSPRLLLH